MLSIENPPPDPSCSSQVLAHLKTSGDEIDLLKKQSLDHQQQQQQQHTPLPKFSIRDYVFTSRGKDIAKNWPFSPKNLQLCLKHGLKDPLPPFQSLDIVRNLSIERCVVETNPFQKQIGEEPSRSNDHVVVESSNDAHSNHNLPGTCVDYSPCRSGGDHENDLPSTTASVSQSDIDTVLVNKQSKLPLQTDTSVEASVEVRAAGKTRKSENTNRPSGKKCRLIVKFGAHSDRSSTEDITLNSTMLSEFMASKVCPVCKTFSSSSNTTLNAHIDQCLSDESTPKWTVDSKITRHRIKPRKTRLMVDVYTTAKPCTLEELDRRNGTTWATASNITRQDSGGLDISDEGKKQRVSRSTPKDISDVGAVYVDAKGTKIRILSKSHDVPQVSKDGDDPGPSKALKECKGIKFLSTKKKRHDSKHHKFLKLASQSQKHFSNKTRSSMICGGQEGFCGVAESCKSEGPHVPKKSSDSRNFKERLFSKQAGLSRKPNNQDRHPPSICKQLVTQDSQVHRDQPHQGDPVVERNCVHKLKNSSGNPISSPEKYEKKVKPVYEGPGMVEREHSFGRKRVRSSLCGPKICNKTELRPLKRNANQLSEDHPRVDKDRMVRSMNSGGNYSSSWSKKVIDIDANSNPDTLVTAKTPSSNRSFAFKGIRSSPKKNVSSARSRSLMVKSGSDHLMTESQLHFMEEIDEDEVSWGPESDQECDLVHDGGKNQRGRKEITEEMSFGGSRIHGARFREHRGRKTISRRDEYMALKSIRSAPHFYDSDETENSDYDSDSSARGSENILDKVDGLDSIEKTFTSLSQLEETKFKKLSNMSENRSNSLQTYGDYSRPLCGGEGLTDLIEPSLAGKPHLFRGEVSHGIIAQTADMGGEADSDVAQLNSFPEVDPIPIPGPPGSFLPSPRDMGSDDFQGNSSLDTARIDSQDQLDMVDGDSSDSPISAVSTISNHVEAKSDLKHAEPLAFEGAPAVLENYSSGYSTAKSEPLVENGAAFPHTSAGLEKTFEGEKFRVHRMSFEKRPMMFTNDDQPCCCQRKGRSSQGFALNYQEPQLLRLRTMPPMMVPAMGMQIDSNQNIDHENFNARPEANSLSNTASLGSEQMVLPVMKPPAGGIAFKGFSDAGVKLSARSDCDSTTPSSSNPVLRLMGKNLMVVNKEVASMPHDQAQSSAQSNRLTPNFPTSGISPDNIRNQGGMPFQHTMPQNSLIFDQHPRDLMGGAFDVQLTNGMFFNERMDCGLTPSMELYKYEGDYNLLAQPNKPENKPGPTAAYDMEKVTTGNSRYRNDDSARYRNPFSRYQSENSLLGDTNFNATSSGRANTVPTRWDCSSEGSGVPQLAPLMAASLSRGILRAAVYHPPSFS